MSPSRSHCKSPRQVSAPAWNRQGPSSGEEALEKDQAKCVQDTGFEGGQHALVPPSCAFGVHQNTKGQKHPPALGPQSHCGRGTAAPSCPISCSGPELGCKHGRRRLHLPDSTTKGKRDNPGYHVQPRLFHFPIQYWGPKLLFSFLLWTHDPQPSA